MSLHYVDLYDLRTITGTRDLAVRLLRALGAASLTLGITYWLFPLLVVEQGMFVLFAAIALLLVIAWRSAFEWVTSHLAPRERLLLVGTSPAAVTLARELFERRQELGVDIVGFVDPDPARVGAPVINPGVVGTIDDIPALTASMRVDRVVVSLSDERGKLPMGQLLDVRLRTGVAFDHLASVYEEYTGKIALENLRPSWLIFSAGFRKTRMLLVAKRTFDIVAAVCGLVLASPLMLLVAVIARPDPVSPGTRRPQRQSLHHPQVPHHARRCGSRHGADLEPRQRHARHLGRPVHAQDAPRRDPAALERAVRRNEPDRSAARAAQLC